MKQRSLRSAAERHTQNPKQGEGQDMPQKPAFEPVLISCPNHPKHGLTCNFRVIACESQEAFDELRDALRKEHAPATPTEFLLVDRLAQHVWLSQRAQNMQEDAAANGRESWFALMLRYQVTHDRGFHKCLTELRALRRERAQQQQPAQQFESQNVTTTLDFESQTPLRFTAAELESFSPAQISALVQHSLDDDEVRIAKPSEAA